jgi:PncC family amidohydrolase
MVRTHVLQAIESPSQRPAWNENIIAFGISESTAAQTMGESLLVDSELCGSIRVSNGLIHMRLEHLDREWAERKANCIREALGPYVLDRNATTPAEALIQQARACGLNIAAAESCTGGGIGAALTHKAGASDVFQGSIVTYANAAKVDLLGVPEPLLGDDGPGAVSGEVAAAMAIGASRALHADAAVSVTGIAGPGGGSDQKPVGTVWVGTVVQGDVRTRQLLLPGRRPRVRMWTVHAASQLLRWHIEGMHAPMQWDAKPPSSGESS